MTSQQITLQSLEHTFGNIPTFIRNDAKYLNYDDNFKCVPCGKTIRKVENNKNDAMTTNFKSHLLSPAHKDKTISSDGLWKLLYQTFSGNIPQIVLNNLYVLGLSYYQNKSYYQCEICEEPIQVSKNVTVSEDNFLRHLLSNTHEEKMDDFNSVIRELEDIYGGIPGVILNHSQFLCVNDKHYFCTICKKHLQVHPSDLDQTEHNFVKHLHSLQHMRNVKLNKAFSLMPELNKVFDCFPNFMWRNIEYFTTNGPNFFCILCQENIKFNRQDIQETQDNFKFHILSSVHEQNLLNRRHPMNDAFVKLCTLFETYPDIVLDNLKVLSTNEDDFYCLVCEETIPASDSEDNNETEENLVSHFESDRHKCNIEEQLSRGSEVSKDLQDVFGCVPETIQQDIWCFEVVKQGFKCIPCQKTIISKDNCDYDKNTSVTAENFIKHLNSSKHEEEVENSNEVRQSVETNLREIFTYIPQYIINNLQHIDYESDGVNFHCYLCDNTITVVNKGSDSSSDFGSDSSSDFGSDSSSDFFEMELTEQNFRSHLLSAGHMAKLKYKANQELLVVEKLDHIFGKVPNFVLNNIEHITTDDNQFLCTLCDTKIILGKFSDTSEENFRRHFRGHDHKINLEEYENNKQKAIEMCDSEFRRLPEFLLRNIDFFSITEDDKLFCLLCQKYPPVYDDFEARKIYLRAHIYSQQHQSFLKNL